MSLMYMLFRAEIQIGAYAVKLNVIAMMSGIKARGYTAFILANVDSESLPDKRWKLPLKKAAG